jgi:hypothetical protein
MTCYNYFLPSMSNQSKNAQIARHKTRTILTVQRPQHDRHLQCAQRIACRGHTSFPDSYVPNGKEPSNWRNCGGEKPVTHHFSPKTHERLNQRGTERVEYDEAIATRGRPIHNESYRSRKRRTRKIRHTRDN